MDVLHARCCGLDVHKSSISACIVLREAGRVQKHQRRFGAMTQDLRELAAWLRRFGVTQVAMESSGVYRSVSADSDSLAGLVLKLGGDLVPHRCNLIAHQNVIGFLMEASNSVFPEIQ